MRNAITCLTRGYNELDKYDTLLKRNDALYQFFSDKYEYVIFHEGNIPEAHQKHIQDNSKQKLTFENVADVWSGGYEGMCRFQSLDVFEKCRRFDYIFRVDEDCFITELTGDPFDNIGDNVYLKSLYWGESHSETNATLPQSIEKLTGAKREDFYNNKFPYTNVGIAKVDFFLSEPMYSVLKAIAYSPEQRANRWGDLPVHGALLNIFAEGRVGQIEGIKYFHLSHGFNVNQKGVVK